MPFADASADVYASRAYGSHLMAQNYSAYLNRDDPYNGHSGLHGSAGHYGPNGPGASALQSAHSMYGGVGGGGGGGGGPISGLSGSGISQQTYPSLPPISHFSHQQDLYSSCLGQRTPSHSLGGSSTYGSLGGGGSGNGLGGSSPLITSGMNASSLSRQHPGSKAYWESVQAAQQQQQQQQQNALYGSAGNTPSHKSSPQSAAAAHWSHSPNVLSSPSSSTPSPIPCPSTPHHFNTSSSPHHQQQQQQHSQQPLVDNTIGSGGGVHKVYNGIGALAGSGSNSSSSNGSGGSSNPLQSLQKMVQIDAESGSDLRAQYETAGPPLPMGAIGGGTNHSSGTAGSGGAGIGNGQMHPMEGDPNFPTYYNLDQNRMCATPLSGGPGGGGGYSNLPPLPPPPSHGPPPQTPFSPTLKNGPPLPPLPQSEAAHHRNNSGGGSGLHSSKSVESDSGNSAADLAMNANNSSRSASVRFSSSKLTKEGSGNNSSFLSNRSCSTDTVCSANSGGGGSGSPSTVGSVKAAASMGGGGEPPAILGEQTHDSVNSFRGSEATANSRDSVKSSSDSDCGVLSAYVASASQCSTPNGQQQSNANSGGGSGSNWKLNSSQQSGDSFQRSAATAAANFSAAANQSGQSVQSSKAWWPENAAAASAISPSPSSRSFTPHLSDCSAGGGGAFGSSNYSSGLQNSSTSNGPPLGSSSSGGPHWSNSAQSSSAQMMSGNNNGGGGFTPDGPVIVKKKRGRPFGSKNRRNLDQQAATSGTASTAGGQATEPVSKRKRKSALVDACVNTTLSFDVPSSLHLDDYTAFESYSSSSLKHAVPLAMKRKKLVGPVVRIDNAHQSNNSSGFGSQPKYSVINDSQSSDELAAKAASISGKSAATFGKPVGVESICLPPPTSTGRKNSALARRCTANSNNNNNSGTNGNVSSTANHNSSISSPSSTPDRSWVCVLCHKGPHHRGLGDLYGPYTVQIERNKLPSSLLDSVTTNTSSSSTSNISIDSTNGPTDQQQTEESAAEQQQQQQQQPQQQQSSSQAPAAVVEQSTVERRSLRRRVDSSAATTGTESVEGKGGKTAHSSNALSHSSSDVDSKAEQPSPRVSLEVWIHEDCIVWSNNVYLDGTVIRNLEQAIVDSFGSICTKCKLPGATLGCIYKSCTVSPLHYLCAKDKDCDLDEEKFILSCSKHKKRRISSSIASKEFEVVEVSEATTTATISEGCC